MKYASSASEINVDPENVAFDLIIPSIGTVKDMVNVETATKTPTSTGRAGQQAWDGTYLYTCVATNTWVRQSPDTTW